jgi:hypothetical protein
LRGALSVVVQVFPIRIVVRMQLGDCLNLSTSSATLTLALALAIIVSLCSKLKLGPLRLFSEISVPN